MTADRPYYEARLAGRACIGETDPETGRHISRIPTQAEVDQETAKLPTAEDIKAEDIIQARVDGSFTLQELVLPYSEEERSTWPTQEAEARAWLIDNDDLCIMIRRIAFHREITVVELVDRIMENVELFQLVAGDILGVQQKAIDDIEAG